MATSIYLASKSPRRRELLDQIGVKYKLVDVEVPEIRQENENPLDYVARLAESKSLAGAEAYTDQPVLGADTIGIYQGRVLEKPKNKGEYQTMLRELSGSEHRVISAVSIYFSGEQETALCETTVWFRDIEEYEIEAYWDTQEPWDKAGGYGIQGLGAVFVDRIEGSYSAVVGLPLCETQHLLKAFNIPIWQR